MVNRMCQLDWLRHAQTAGKTLFLDVSRRLLPEEISIRICELSEADALPNVSGHHPICWGPRENKKAEEECVCSSSVWARTSSFSFHQVLAFLVFWASDWDADLYHWPPLDCRPLNSNWFTSLAFIVLHLQDSRWCDFLASIIAWANSYNQFPHIDISRGERSYWYRFSGES